MLRFSAGLMILSIVSFAPLAAQEPTCLNRTLPVSFRDAQNLPITDIAAADLEAKVHGKRVKILSLEPDRRSHRIVLILDISGSIRGFGGDSSLWGLEMALASHFYEEVNRQNTRMALLFFNERVTDVIELSQGNSAVGDKLHQIAKDSEYVKKNLKGRTALRDAILEGVQLLDHPNSADALYVLTDAGDNASTHKTADVTRRLAVTPVRLFAIVLRRRADYPTRVPDEILGRPELSEIAEMSGGEILSAAERYRDSVALSANSDGKLETQEVLSRLTIRFFMIACWKSNFLLQSRKMNSGS
jgi:hypothetical protein